ncbi:MAG: tRNA 2-thiouridine(34) synthase MnmA [bacterium]
MSERIVVAMSGGVDSSVTACLLKKHGCDVIGVHMRVWHYEQGDSCAARFNTCCTPKDMEDARGVAEQFGFPFYNIDFERDFDRKVVSPFVSEYLRGRTPNPCVHCNTHLKLGVLLSKAKLYGAGAVATGHYVKVEQHPATGRFSLRRGKDRAKDQSYPLFELRQEQLACLRTPLGDYTKDEVRQMAREFGLRVAEKPDSYEICFIPDNDYRRFLRQRAEVHRAMDAGDIVDAQGRVVGRHEGIAFYTIGQRRGLGGGRDKPLYVVDLRPESNQVVVGESEELLARGLEARGCNWVAAAGLEIAEQVEAQIRNHHQPARARIEPGADGRVICRFEEPQRAVTPGQAVVFYQGDRVFGGGWIERPIFD